MSFPLVTLQPVANARHGWVALSLDSSGGLDATSLGRVFCEFGLYDALGGLPCVVAIDDAPPDLSDYIPAQDIILRLPVASCLKANAAPLLRRLQQDGFRLIADGLPPAGSKLPASVTGIALDCGSAVMPHASEHLSQLPSPQLALGIDSTDALARCRDARFQWFAGSYPLRPSTATGNTKTGAPASAPLLKLLSLVAQDAETHDIEMVLRQDAHLSYLLLRLVNSVSFALTQKISSFGQALQLLGRRQLQRWLQLLLYANPVAGGASPLLPRAALRAARMEALLRQAGNADSGGDIADQAFMAGMFSLLDALLGKPLLEVVAPLNLADDLAAALLERRGRLGQLLDVVIAAEGTPASFGPTLAGAGIAPDAWAETLAQSCRWPIQVSRETE
ncbi:MAG: HDOD domain-containing protein [Gammaproteobacteria bacterium]|nr:HDOD domain-containing protein [Gammaproteobacteria bacterium]MBU1645558.1 HDOD domain-containing protein [Gammaproteobacteria bacterium]MBU1973640.1 HDOD domain-containing protein [Gammaproteobacteria bacterium]